MSNGYFFVEPEAQPAGVVGVLGPTRMDYPKVMGLLQTVANNLTQTLTRLFS